MFQKIISLSLLALFCTNILAEETQINTATIENSGENKYKSIRLTPEIYNNANSDLSDLRIKDSNGEYLPFFIRTGKDEKIETEIMPKFSVEEEDKTTHVFIDGLKNLNLEQMTIETDSMFRRPVSTSLGVSKELYNLTFGDTTRTDTTIYFNRLAFRDDTFLLTIRNGDDRPIKISGIVVRFYADELVFEGGAGDYTLHFGADPLVKPPVYDIVRYKNEIINEEFDHLEITQFFFAPTIEVSIEEPEPQSFDYTLLFNIAVVAVAVVLALVILLKLKKKS
ncbi:MAG: hypothetical protein FWH05_02975 [Oscillospiraceae bacterium]|nr:hypothetical protein [Oscillospiraceae bacterium]